MWKVINVYKDRTNTAKHRTASGLDYEPSIAGVRLQLGHLMLLTDGQFLRVRPMLESWKKKGMIDFAPAKGNEAPKTGVSVPCKPEHKITKEVGMLEQVAPYQSPLAPETDRALGGHAPVGSAETASSTDMHSVENQVARHGFDPKLESETQNPALSAYRNVPESQELIQDEVDRKIPSGDEGWAQNPDVREADSSDGEDDGEHSEHIEGTDSQRAETTEGTHHSRKKRHKKH